jgi:hypothetical protein
MDTSTAATLAQTTVTSFGANVVAVLPIVIPALLAFAAAMWAYKLISRKLHGGR